MRFGDFHVVTKNAIESQFEGIDSAAHPQRLFVIGQPFFVVLLQAAQAIKFAIKTWAQEQRERI